MTEPYTPVALKIITRHAGVMPPQEIAAALGWTTSRLERVAAEQRIDLTIREKLPAPEQPQFSAAGNVAKRSGSIRNAHFTVSLTDDVARVLREKAAARFMRPSRLFAEMLAGAVARGKVDELVSAASFHPRGNSEK